jgi:hypothetical protein
MMQFPNMMKPLMNDPTMTKKKPLWEAIQAEVEEGVMGPPIGSIFGPQEYARGIQAVIDYLTDQWRHGYDTAEAVRLLKMEKAGAVNPTMFQ